MRQWAVLFCSTILFLFLSSCGGSKDAESLAQDIRVNIIGMETLELTADVRADYGDKVYDFGLSFTGDENNGIIDVLAPESIAGFQIAIKDGKTHTEFDGVELYMGEVDKLETTPACTFTTLIGAWKNGYITNSRFELVGEKDAVALTICVTDTVETQTWFDKESLAPLRAEIICDGKTVIFCTFTDNT